MHSTAATILPLAVLFLTGCAHSPNPAPPRPTEQSAATSVFTRSPYRLVGHVLAVDGARGTAFVDLMEDAAEALAEGVELVARTHDLHPTARLAVTRYRRGQTLAVTILAGEPAPDDEVVWYRP